MNEIDGKVLSRLEKWQEKAEVPSELVAFYRSLLRIQLKAERRIGIPSPGLSTEAISARLDSGLPLVQFDELRLDWSLFKDVFDEVTSIFAGHDQLFGRVPQSLIELGASSLLEDVARAEFSGTELPTAVAVERADKPLLANIIQATLKPFLVGHARSLQPYVNQERWRRGYCPICGGNPDLAFLEKEYGARWLLCCRCDTEWLFQRLECPYCGNQNQNTLAYYTDDDGRYRLYVCEQCQQYLKTVDLRRTNEEVVMSLERLFTFGLDAQAREYGYGHGAKPASA